MRIPDDEYFSDFHKLWNEACMKERERTLSIRFTAEYLRAQSQCLKAVIEKEDLMAQLEGKRRRKKGITDEDINKRIDELLKIITECKEVARKHPPINKNV